MIGRGANDELRDEDGPWLGLVAAAKKEQTGEHGERIPRVTSSQEKGWSIRGAPRRVTPKIARHRAYQRRRLLGKIKPYVHPALRVAAMTKGR